MQAFGVALDLESGLVAEKLHQAARVLVERIEVADDVSLLIGQLSPTQIDSEQTGRLKESGGLKEEKAGEELKRNTIDDLIATVEARLQTIPIRFRQAIRSLTNLLKELKKGAEGAKKSRGSREEIRMNPEGEYTIDDLIATVEDGLCTLEVDERQDPPKYRGTILGCSFENFAELCDLLSSIILTNRIPETNIPVKLKIDSYFKETKEEFNLSSLKYDICYSPTGRLSEASLTFIQEGLPRYLRQAFIEPLKALKNDEHPVDGLVRNQDDLLNVLKSGDLSEPEKFYILASQIGNVSWEQLPRELQEIIENMSLGGIRRVGGKVICLPSERPGLECSQTENQLLPDISINGVIKTSHLEWTNAVVDRTTIFSEGGTLFPNVLMLPSGPTAVAIGLAYMQKYSQGGKLRDITNLQLPAAVFRADRPKRG